MKLASLISAASLLTSVVLSKPMPMKPSTSLGKRWPGFVYTDGEKFGLDGKPFFFAGTNAYYLTQLNTEDDIVKTLKDIAKIGLKVVRIWGFREVVGEAPANNKTYTALWNNGVQTFNQCGLDRIKFILDTAECEGLKIQLSLTNNWAPTFPPNPPRPLGYYSNSFGGADTYVQQLYPGGDHDLFYSHDEIISQYEYWVKHIVLQFKDHAGLFGWEIGNDPRCKGAIGTTTSDSCNPQTITGWTNRLSSFIKSVDPNHLVASGDQGFYCVDCPKLNSLPNSRKRSNRRHGWLTAADVLADRHDAAVKRALREARAVGGIRGAWSASLVTLKSWTKRASVESSVGAPYDGSQGVDTEDISASPHVDFTSFQLFPDQNSYQSGADSDKPPAAGAGGANFQATVSEGLNWITQHSDSASTVGKPSSLSAFGLVSQDSETNFTPFDSTHTGIGDTDPVATDTEQQTAYTQWTNQAVTSGINGITHYQWGQTGLTSVPGSVVDNSNTFGDSSSQTGKRQVYPGGTNNVSPNDGYSSGPYSGVQAILGQTATKQNGKDAS